MLTQDLLRELFDYNPETGEFIRRFPSKQSTRINPEPDRYKAVRVAGKQHRVHRLVWLYMFGEIPKGKSIDHINGNRHDNRLCNLRLVTHKQNNQNSRVRTTNKTGYKGVALGDNKYKVYISIDNKTIHIGTFGDVIEAARAYDSAAIAAFGEYAKTNVVLGLLPPIHEAN